MFIKRRSVYGVSNTSSFQISEAFLHVKEKGAVLLNLVRISARTDCHNFHMVLKAFFLGWVGE